MYTIEIRDKYVLIKIEGEASYQVFLKIIQEMQSREEIYNANDIWQLENCTLSISYDEFEIIKKSIIENYPPKITNPKTALVASAGTSRALMQFWIDSVTTLPFDIQTFMTLEEAEAWL